MQGVLNSKSEFQLAEEVIPTEGPEQEITECEIQLALKGMKAGKAAGKSGVCTEMLRALGEVGVNWLTRIFNRVWLEGQMPQDWREGTVIPIYKGKGDLRDCNSYRPIKLLEHSMKVMERVVDRRLRQIVRIDEMQRGFMPGRSTTDAIFAIKTLIEKHISKDKELWTAFVDLEKAYDRVPRDLIWWAMRNQGVGEQLVKIVQVMYKDTVSRVRVASVCGPQFQVNTGVHQGSALSPLLFIIVMEEVSKRTRQGVPWEILFADDLAIISDKKETLATRLEQWKNALESAGLKVNINKTKVMKIDRHASRKTVTGKYPCCKCGKGVGANSIQCTECQKWTHAKCTKIKGGLTKATSNFKCILCSPNQTLTKTEESNLKIGGSQYERVEEFTYLGHTLEATGGSNSAVRARIRSAWASWKRASLVLLQKKVSLKLKGWLYAVTIRSALLYSAETWALRLEEIRALERTQMSMLRWMAGIRMCERRKNEDIRKAFGLEPISDVIRRIRLRWFGHVYRREPEHLTRACQAVDIEGHVPRGRPRLTWHAQVTADLRALNVSECAALDRVLWRQVIR